MCPHHDLSWPFAKFAKISPSHCEVCIKLINHNVTICINQTDWTPTRDGWYRDCFYSWLDNSVAYWLCDVISLCFLTLDGQFPSAYATRVFVDRQNRTSCLANKHNVYSNQPELWAHICSCSLRDQKRPPDCTPDHIWYVRLRLQKECKMREYSQIK